jgi:hypothetical protein
MNGSMSMPPYFYFSNTTNNLLSTNYGLYEKIWAVMYHMITKLTIIYES